MTAIRLQTILCLMTITAIGVGFCNWFLKPDGIWAWLIGSFSLPVLWGVVALIEQKRPMRTFSSSERRMFSTSVISAGLMLLVAQSIHLIELLGFGTSTTIDRVWGVTVGIILMVIGNATPKVMPPLNVQACTLQSTHKMQRFAGWALLLGGAGYVLSWLFLPINLTNEVATLCCFMAVAAIGLRISITQLSNKSSIPDSR